MSWNQNYFGGWRLVNWRINEYFYNGNESVLKNSGGLTRVHCINNSRENDVGESDNRVNIIRRQKLCIQFPIIIIRINGTILFRFVEKEY